MRCNPLDDSHSTTSGQNLHRDLTPPASSWKKCSELLISNCSSAEQRIFSPSSTKSVIICSLTTASVCAVMRQRPLWLCCRAADDTHRYLTLCRAAPAERCKVNNGHIGLYNCWTCTFTPQRDHTHIQAHLYLIHISLCTCMCHQVFMCMRSHDCACVDMWHRKHVVKIKKRMCASQGRVNNRQTKQRIPSLWKTTLYPPSNLAPTNTYRWDINGLLCPLWPFNYSDLCTEQACRNCISISAGLLNVPVEGELWFSR